MSSGIEVAGSQRRPGIWSYFGFSGPRRRVSVSLPRTLDSNRDDEDDPHVKAARHSRHRSTYSDAFMNEHKGSAVMNQGQRLRYLKAGGVIAFILLVLYMIAPSDRIPRPGGMYTTGHSEAQTDINRCITRRRQHCSGRCQSRVHQVLLKGQAPHPIRPDDRRRQHWVAHPRVQVQ